MTTERPGATTLARRPLTRTVWMLVVARAVNQLGAFTLPFLSITLVTDLGASVGGAGLVLAAFGAATIPSRLLGGRLADRVGPRTTIVGGLVLTAAAQLAVFAAGSLTEATVAVVALGLVFEIYEPPSQSLVADVTPADQRPAAYGLLAAAMAAAGMAAGLLAAVLAGVDLRWLFVADAVSCLLCAALVAALLPRAGADRDAAAARPEPGSRSGSPWRDPRLLAMLALGTAFAVVYLQVTITLPLTLAERGIGPSTMGLLLTLSAATLALGQWLVMRSGRRIEDDFTAMAVGYVLLGVGLAGNGLAHDRLGFAAATVVWSLGDLVLIGRSHAVVAALAAPTVRGRYLAAFGTCWGVAAIAAPLVGTQLFERLGPTAAWLAVAGLCLALAAGQRPVRGMVAREALR